MIGIVMEGDELFYVREPCELECVPNAAMAEANSALVFRFCILRVVDEHVGALCESVT
jgi:hypothetical protein